MTYIGITINISPIFHLSTPPIIPLPSQVLPSITMGPLSMLFTSPVGADSIEVPDQLHHATSPPMTISGQSNDHLSTPPSVLRQWHRHFLCLCHSHHSISVHFKRQFKLCCSTCTGYSTSSAYQMTI